MLCYVMLCYVHCVFGPLLVHLCALCVPVQLYEIMMMMMKSGNAQCLKSLSCGCIPCPPVIHKC